MSPAEGRGLQIDAKTLELMRRHAWDGQRGRTLIEALAIRAGSTVVDVGCGTGAFTRVLARRLDPKRGGRAIGVDHDAQLVRAARQLAQDEDISRSVLSFEEGDARKLPLRDQHADRVVCQALLWLMTAGDRRQALGEMVRVCKKGGLVGAVETAVETAVDFHPGSDRLSELRTSQYRAQGIGYRRLLGYDRNIGVKLPALFRELGLRRVRLEAVADARLQNDDRVSPEERTEEMRHSSAMNETMLASVESAGSEEEKRAAVEAAEPALIAGGMGWRDVYELAKLYDRYARGALESQQAMDHDSSVHVHVMFITTGIRP